MKLYNLTLHKQLDKVKGFEVEENPRLKPVNDISDWDEILETVETAIKSIPDGSDVLVGGLGQFQAIIQQWADHHQCRLWFAVMDETRHVIGFTMMPFISRRFGMD